MKRTRPAPPPTPTSTPTPTTGLARRGTPLATTYRLWVARLKGADAGAGAGAGSSQGASVMLRLAGEPQATPWPLARLFPATRTLQKLLASVAAAAGAARFDAAFALARLRLPPRLAALRARRPHDFSGVRRAAKAILEARVSRGGGGSGFSNVGSGGGGGGGGGDGSNGPAGAARVLADCAQRWLRVDAVRWASAVATFAAAFPFEGAHYASTPEAAVPRALAEAEPRRTRHLDIAAASASASEQSGAGAGANDTARDTTRDAVVWHELVCAWARAQTAAAHARLPGSPLVEAAAAATGTAGDETVAEFVARVWAAYDALALHLATEAAAYDMARRLLVAHYVRAPATTTATTSVAAVVADLHVRAAPALLGAHAPLRALAWCGAARGRVALVQRVQAPAPAPAPPNVRKRAADVAAVLRQRAPKRAAASKAATEAAAVPAQPHGGQTPVFERAVRYDDEDSDEGGSEGA